MKTDFSKIKNLCGSPSFSWYAFMDHAFQGGGPLPLADNFWSSALVKYNDFKPTGRGATRAMMGWQGQWDYLTGALNLDGTPEKKHSSFLIEINFYLDPAWGKSPNTPIDVVTYNPGTKYPFYYIALDGSKYLPAKIFVKRMQEATLAVHWTSVVSDLIKRNLFPQPIGGLSKIKSEATFLATEVRNNELGIGGPVSDLWFTNYRTTGQAP